MPFMQILNPISGLLASQNKIGNATSPSMPSPPIFTNLQDERLHRKQRLAAGFRLFSKMGFDEGIAGHITARDPEFIDTFWVNPFGVHFSQVSVSNLIRVDHHGNVIEGKHPVNAAAFAIHSQIHLLRPDVVAAAHTHSPQGRAFSTLGVGLDALTQDACAFYGDHAVYPDYGGVVVEIDEGVRVSKALGSYKAAILQNHGLLTVADTVDAAVWWYISMERCCQVQLLAMASGKSPIPIKQESAQQAYSIVGSSYAGWFSFQPLYSRIIKEQPDLLD
jgi:ribulose-5-phosphate 4-epimerase/fuculose-1-phosphate aldolase